VLGGKKLDGCEKKEEKHRNPQINPTPHIKVGIVEEKEGTLGNRLLNRRIPNRDKEMVKNPKLCLRQLQAFGRKIWKKNE